MLFLPTALISPTAPLTAWIQSLQGLEPALLVVHLFCAAGVIGAVLVFDLRLLGLARHISVQSLHGVLIPLALLLSVPAAASGALLFALHADALIGNGAFVLKVIALFAAAINAMIFFTGPYQHVARWPEQATAPLGARVCAALSIVLLLAIVTLGTRVASAVARL